MIIHDVQQFLEDPFANNLRWRISFLSDAPMVITYPDLIAFGTQLGLTQVDIYELLKSDLFPAQFPPANVKVLHFGQWPYREAITTLIDLGTRQSAT